MCAVLGIEPQPLKMPQTPLSLGFLLSLESNNQPRCSNHLLELLWWHWVFQIPKGMPFSFEFPSFMPALFSHVPLLSSCAALLDADMTALLPSAQHSSAKILNFLSVTFLLASDSHVWLSLLNLLLGNYKLKYETPSISTWEKKWQKGKDTLIENFIAILQGTAPTRNHSQFAVSANWRSVWVVFPLLGPIINCCFSLMVFSNDNQF